MGYSMSSKSPSTQDDPKIPVRSRVSRVLKRLERFYEQENLPDELQEVSQLSSLGDFLGVYQNIHGECRDAVGVFEQGYSVRRSDQIVEVRYDEIDAILPWEDKTTQLGLHIILHDESRVFVPVSGGQGRFRDVFAFYRFFDRVMSDLK